MNLSDTICAIATPQGEGGIGIVRISGTRAQEIAKALFIPRTKPKSFQSHRLYYGTIINPSDQSPLDSALMAVMRKPNSFTGEDVVEFHCHGGQLVLQRVLEQIMRQGARLAEPGEFTKRGFLNNKMDLAQAEAVIDLIRAKTDLSFRIAQSQLEGRLSQKISAIKEDMANLLAHIEAELDFPDEEDVGGLSFSTLQKRLKGIENELTKLLSTYEEGKVLREGISCIILGRPNVGKSSLLNLLLREERAIVTPIPGTTRDVIEEVVNIKGIPLRLMDTAGLRETDDAVETMGIRFTMKRLEQSEMALFVVDLSQGEFEEDLKILDTIVDKKLIVVENKKDIANKNALDSFHKTFHNMNQVEISALQDIGLEELRQTIYHEAVGHTVDEPKEIMLSNARHKNALENAHHAITKAQETLQKKLSGEFVAVELKEAVERLGEITGEVTTEDILDRIFSQFCIGK